MTIDGYHTQKRTYGPFGDTVTQYGIRRAYNQEIVDIFNLV